MDHLKTDAERKERWYATHLTPRLVKVVPAQKWEDLLLAVPQDSQFVWSVPFNWLRYRDDVTSDSGVRDASSLQASLEANGYIVISGVLNERDCATALDLAWDWLEAASYAERRTASTTTRVDTPPETRGYLPADNVQDVVRRRDRHSFRNNFPRSVEGGIQPFYGSGHSTLAWFVRDHPNVRQVFASLHNASQDVLLASLDGIILWPRTLEDGSGGDAGWFHIDQNPRHWPDRQSVQGLVNLLPVSLATGGNTLVAQSHRLFPSHYVSGDAPGAATTSDFYRQRLDEVGTDDWLEIDPKDDTLLRPSQVIMLELAPGDVLLWDSRTAHCSYPPSRQCDTDRLDAAEDAAGLIRAATLVNMVPLGPESSREAMSARRDAAVRMRTLTHWVNKAAPLGNERADQVTLEDRRVAAVLEWECLRGKTVLLNFDDLSSQQRALVVGDQGTST